MDSKCYFVKLTALYSQKVLYGYNCNLDSIYAQMYEAKRIYILEQNKDTCGLYGDVIDEINKFNKKINSTPPSFCIDCDEPKELTCNDIIVSLTNVSFNNTYTFSAAVTNGTSPINYIWSYDPTLWSLVVKNGNYITLESIVDDGIPVNTNVGVSITDSNGCIISTYNSISYKKESPICVQSTADICLSTTTSTLNSSGEYNGRNYYKIYCSDLVTLVGYIYWNNTLNRWDFRDELGSGTLYSYLSENTYYPTGDWMNEAVDVATITKALPGPCEIN
jgi:hypothetical protein